MAIFIVFKLYNGIQFWTETTNDGLTHMEYSETVITWLKISLIFFLDPHSQQPEKAVAPHSSTLAWKIPWMEEPGGLQSMGSLRVGHDWATSLSCIGATSLSLSCIGEGNGNPLQCSCLENPRDGGAWWAAIYGVAQSQTWLKQLSRSRIVNSTQSSQF